MKEIKKVCVAGAGNMGRQIAINAAMSGFDSSVKTSKPDENLQWCKNFLEKGIAKGKYDSAEAEAALSRMKFFKTIEESVSGADLIIESIIEEEGAKREFFSAVNRYAPPDALVTSNSSYIATSAYVDIVSNPGRLANLHYFNPVMSMQLVEIVHGEHTAPDTIEALQAFAKRIGKIAIVVHKEIEGFVVNRLLRAVQDEAYSLYESGIASFADIDIAAEKGLNYPMGPFRLVDFTGIDINYLNRKHKYEQTGLDEDRPPKFLSDKYEAGEFGRKSGKGFYTY